jgi:antitoxin (DNA-binding transcriptional repressor) of toxin-antitoxin stability system
MDKSWPVQDAKARFSELLRAAEEAPQTISYRGEPRFEIRLKTTAAKKKKGLPRWWTQAPKSAAFRLPPRKRDRMRDPGF